MIIPARSFRSLRTTSLVVIILIFLVYTIYSVAEFVHIFFEHAGTASTQDQVVQAHESVPVDLRQPVVPRIIHQVYHNWEDASNETLPADWQAERQTCINHNPDWEHWLWTERKSRDFLIKEYPAFLQTYDSYTFPIQRIDALRYFLMRHYGGIYIDLDNGCNATLEPLLYYPAWVTDGGCGALSNNILGAEPNHPYWILMTESLEMYAWNYLLPYITISYATGQWFETVIWEKYHRQRSKDEPALHRIMMDGRQGAAPWVFFYQARGGTWVNWDNLFFIWLGDHLLITFVLVSGLAITVVAGVVMAVRSQRAKVNRSLDCADRYRKDSLEESDLLKKRNY